MFTWWPETTSESFVLVLVCPEDKLFLLVDMNIYLKCNVCLNRVSGIRVSLKISSFLGELKDFFWGGVSLGVGGLR